MSNPQYSCQCQFNFASRQRRPQKTLVRASGCTVSPAQGTIQAIRLCCTVAIATAYKQHHIHSASTRVYLITAFAFGPSFTVRVSHLTGGSVSVLLCANLVVLGNFDPLVSLHAGLTQPFSTLHTEAYGSCIVLATCANLEKITPMSI